MSSSETQLNASQKSVVGNLTVGGSGLMFAANKLPSITAVRQRHDVIFGNLFPELAIFLVCELLANLETMSTWQRFCNGRQCFWKFGKNCRKGSIPAVQLQTTYPTIKDPQTSSRFGRSPTQLAT